MNDQVKELYFLKEIKALAEQGLLLDMLFRLQSRIEELEVDIKAFEESEEQG